MKRIILVVCLLLAGLGWFLLKPDGGEDPTHSQASIFLPDPKPGTIEYINPDIPDFKDPEYPGEYYDAVVPATLD